MLFFLQLWPIFAPGGEYGPKYDVMDDEDVLTKRGSSSSEAAADLFVDAFSKKDLESLLHQPDPSLTVQELPLNPKISFRKGTQLFFISSKSFSVTFCGVPKMKNPAKET